MLGLSNEGLLIAPDRQKRCRQRSTNTCFQNAGTVKSPSLRIKGLRLGADGGFWNKEECDFIRSRQAPSGLRWFPDCRDSVAIDYFLPGASPTNLLEARLWVCGSLRLLIFGIGGLQELKDFIRPPDKNSAGGGPDIGGGLSEWSKAACELGRTTCAASMKTAELTSFRHCKNEYWNPSTGIYCGPVERNGNSGDPLAVQ